MKDQLIDRFFPPVKEDFLSSRLERPYILRRFDRGDDRYYYQEVKGKIANAYISNTTLTSKVLPTGIGIKRWIGNMGYEAAMKEMALKAAYGTIYHIEALRPFKEKGYSFDDLEKRFPDMLPYWARDYAEQWIEPLKRDLNCWFLFVKERVKEVLAIEIPLKSDKWGCGGTLDFVGIINFNRKDVPAIIDLKSGKKGFFEAHELQLKMCREEWNESFELQVEHLFNFAPVDYRSKVTYKLENQTKKMTGTCNYEGKNIMEWELHLLQAKAQGLVRPPKRFEAIHGSFKNIKDFNPDDHSVVYNL